MRNTRTTSGCRSLTVTLIATRPDPCRGAVSPVRRMAFRNRGTPAAKSSRAATCGTISSRKGGVQDATVETERVVALGASVDDPLLKAQAWTLQASHVQDTGGDLGVAYRLLKQSERAIFPHGSVSSQTQLPQLARVGRVPDGTARRGARDLRAARSACRRGRETRSSRPPPATTSSTSSSLKESLLPTPGAKQRLMRLAERVAGGRAVGAAHASSR